MQVEEAGIRALIVDSEQALAQGIAQALAARPGIADARAAGSPAGVVAALGEAAADVVVVATDAEGWDPIGLVREVAGRTPPPAVVAMSGAEDPAPVSAAIVAGAVSWVPKQVSLDQLAVVVAAAARDEAWLPPRMLARVLRLLAEQRQDAPAPIDRLTFRELQILRHTARGLTRRQIAAELEVSVNTVRSHSQNMLSKLGVHTTLEAVALVLREDYGDEPATGA